MKRYFLGAALLLLLGLHLATATNAQAMIQGITRAEYHFTAEVGYIYTADGGTLQIWGLNDTDGALGVQYPAPTLLLMEGDTVTIHLTNMLGENTSLVFPGQENVLVSGGVAGLLTNEAGPGVTVSYTFTANHAGTYLYHSGTHADLQVEMGLFGAIIVYPGDMMMAYDHMDTMFDREYLFLLSEMDPDIHKAVEFTDTAFVDTTDYFPTLWFINGRNAPDTMAPSYAVWLPSQPYGAMVQMHPGETILLRFIGAGRDLHPFHTHANNMLQIARDGRLLESAPGVGPDLAVSDFTATVTPGETIDALFTWTGSGMGWDFYGHTDADPLMPGENPDDHGKPFPVLFPQQQSLLLGEGYSGSPFLGQFGPLPPNHVSVNMNGGFFYMWHSHAEKEMVNDDIFPGGMMTMLIIEHPDVEIMEM